MTSATAGPSALRGEVAVWLLLALAGLVLLPWYMQEDGLFSLVWLTDGWIEDEDYAPGLFQALLHGRWWLLPLPLLLALSVPGLFRRQSRVRAAGWLILGGGLTFAWLLFQGFAINHRGWAWPWLAEWFGPLDGRQYGMGWGALLLGTGALFLLTQGIADRGAAKGDAFVVGSIGLIVVSVGLFIFFPIFQVLENAVLDNDARFAPMLFAAKLTDAKIWSLSCVATGYRCGVAWNTVFLAVLTGAGTTLLGLAFALVVTRTSFRLKRVLRILTVLPIITPPFVVGLAIILLLGRSGTLTQFVAALLDVTPGRWIYGLPGIWIAQMLAFTPIAFLVLIGVVEGVSPSLEEAAQTLRADAWTTFRTVSLPLMRPGLANAFLLGFIESMADFGNPLVLGGNYDVLSTEIFFAIVGAQHDAGRAAVLAIILLSFTLLAFWAQQRWVGRSSYTTVTGKGDSGRHLALPRLLDLSCRAVALPWAVFTLVIYAMILFGGFVEVWGRDHSLTLRHYVHAFSVTVGEHGLVWSGSAWNSFWTTLRIAALSAVPTALIGLLTAWLLVRQRFAGKKLFEFGTMLSFAIPGTVIGVSYILAFNVPPIEITGTGIILILSFIFRNMPVGVRAGVAALAQLDPSLDEASLTLRASTWTTLRRILLPLLKPAMLAALVYAFVRAMTAVSAVVFLVSADYDLATNYILGRVENGDYGLAIAYSSVLIVVMLAAIGLMQLAVGSRKLGRRGTGTFVPVEQSA